MSQNLSLLISWVLITLLAGVLYWLSVRQQRKVEQKIPHHPASTMETESLFIPGEELPAEEW